MDEAMLLAYLKGNLSESENKEVDLWVSKSADNYKKLEQIYYTTFVGDRLHAYESVDVEAALNKFHTKIKPQEIHTMDPHPFSTKLYRIKKYGGLAAAFFTGIILSVGILLGILAQPSTYQVSTFEGQRAHVVLPDGSYVWLNSSTKLAYQSGILSKERKVDVNGEAYFEVTKNKNKPFVVNSKGVRTQVLGTKFNVRARNQESKVVTTLFEGAIQMYTHSSDKLGQRLKPGETLEIDVTTHQSNLFTYNTPKDVLLWINGDLKFNNNTLGEMAEKFEKVYNVRFHFENEEVRQERFTCKFKTDFSLKEILSTLSLTQHFSYDITDDGRVLVFSSIKE